MSTGSTDRSEPVPRSGQKLPIVVLLLLSPILSEFLFGTAKLTTIVFLLPMTGIWGCGTLLIRELVRRRRRGWLAILLLGLALALLEECVIQQTSLRPLIGSDPEHPYARFFGVNWVYLLWALVYESVWCVMLPILLAELIFPARRQEPWLGRLGLGIATGFMALSSCFVWFIWGQIFLPQFFPELVYHVPAGSIGLAIVWIGILIWAALGPFKLDLPARALHRVRMPDWLIALVAFLFALPWFGLIFMAYSALPDVSPLIPLAAGLIWAGLGFFWVHQITCCSDWTDRSNFALISACLLANMLAGFAVMHAAGDLAVDVIAKAILNLLAIGLLIRLRNMIRNRARNILDGDGAGRRSPG